MKAKFSLVGLFALAANVGLGVDLPEGYVRLKYIVSSGAQYIDTGRKLYAPSDEVHMKFRCTEENDQGMLFGNRVDGTHKAFAAHYNDTGRLDGMVININDSDATGNLWRSNDYKPSVPTIYNVMMEITASVYGATVTFDGLVTCGPKVFANHDTFETVGTCTVLKGVSVNPDGSGLPNMHGVTGELHAFSIVSNTVTVLDLIPVRRMVAGELEVGMFDVVSGTFFGNAGEGAFASGPVEDEGGQDEPVHEDGIVIENLKGRAVELSFDAADSARKLFVYYGVADCGSVFSDWNHYEKVADVAAGATTATAMLPDGLGKTYAVARFVLSDAVDSYAGDMIAWYDGIDNVRQDGDVGHREGKGGTWANLAGESGMTLAGDCIVEANGVVYDRTTGSASGSDGAAFQSASYGVNDIGTIEVVMRIDGVQSGADGALWSGAGAKSPIPQARVHEDGRAVTCGWNSEGLGNITNPYLTIEKGVPFSVAYVRSGTTWTAYVNGRVATVVGQSTPSTFDFPSPTAGPVDFGNISSVNRGTKGKFYSIRLHSTSLTGAQIEANYRYDCERFPVLGKSSLNTCLSPVIGSPVDGVMVTELRRDEKTKVVSSVVLEFAKTRGMEDLYVALANADRGGSTNGWDIVTKVATVAVGAKSMTCDLSALPCGNYRKIRFFLQTEASRSDYANKGSLIGRWDGVDNSVDANGTAYHNSQMSEWTDLVRHAKIVFNDLAHEYAIENGVSLEMADGQRAVAAGPFGASDIQTFEVAITLNGSCLGDGALWGGYSSANVAPIPQCRVGRRDAGYILGWNSADSEISNPFYAGNWGDVVTVTYVRKNLLEYEAYTNGAPTGVSYEFTPADGRISIGGFSFAERGVDAVYHSIRLYSKALTPAEIAANYAVDKAWLVDPKPFKASSAISTRQQGLVVLFF